MVRELGISHETLRGWVRRAEAAARPPASGELSAPDPTTATAIVRASSQTGPDTDDHVSAASSA